MALAALTRVDHDGAYANLVLPPLLERSGLDERDRAFATDLVYGTVRMRRACDVAVDRFVLRDPDPHTRTLLRLGAYQLLFGGVAPHAAVAETVALAPARTRGFLNALLRRVATTPPAWPSDAARLSYPDWIVERLAAELGAADALAALETMNRPPAVHRRDDGYVQDPASVWVADAVAARPGELVVDLCAAPGGKATAIAHTGAHVVAADRSPARAGLVRANALATGTAAAVSVVVADGRRSPLPAGCADRVLLDAPCSGLGVLRRRPDARWSITEDALAGLVVLQQELLDAAADLVRPGGVLVYSVCTLTAAESIGHRFPHGWDPLPVDDPAGRWRPYGPGARVLPQDHDTDGMTIVRYRRPA